MTHHIYRAILAVRADVVRWFPSVRAAIFFGACIFLAGIPTGSFAAQITIDSNCTVSVHVPGLFGGSEINYRVAKGAIFTEDDRHRFCGTLTMPTPFGDAPDTHCVSTNGRVINDLSGMDNFTHSDCTVSDARDELMKSVTVQPVDNHAFSTPTVAHVVAQSSDQPFVRPDPTKDSTSEPPCNFEYPAKIPVRCWTGQKFIIQQMAPELRSYGYQSFKGGSGDYGAASYDELAGKVITVTNVRWEQNDHLPTLNGYVVEFQADGSSTVYSTRPVILPFEGRDDAIVDHFASLRDLQRARDLYVGKQYWIMDRNLPRVGSEITSQDLIQFPKASSVTITDVLASDDSSKPIQLVLKNPKGEEGYLNIPGSGTNVESSLYAVLNKDPLGTDLSSNNPRATHHWPPRVWAAIQNEKVFIGMSKDQAEMSWGTPTDVNRTIQNGHVHEQWVYSENSYIYFDDGVLTAIQN